MKNRAVLERLGNVGADGGEPPARVWVEAQDGTTAPFGGVRYFPTVSEADAFMRGVEIGLKVAGVWDHSKSISETFGGNLPLMARLRELRDYYASAKTLAAQLPPGPGADWIERAAARRWRLALWVLGRTADARAVRTAERSARSSFDSDRLDYLT